MIAFPGKLRGESESILAGERRSRNTVLGKSMQLFISAGQASLTSSPACMLPFDRASRTLF